MNTQALTSTTANQIHGTPPYIELNGTKIVDFNELLSIQIGGNTYISDNSGNMKQVYADGSLVPISLITLPAPEMAVYDVYTPVSADTSSYPLDDATIVPLASRKDDDGDDMFSITGNLQGEWKDNENETVQIMTEVFDICKAPYTLTLTTTDIVSINTHYGLPNSTVYDNTIAKFKIKPNSPPKVCFAKPNMRFSDANFADPGAGWSVNNGFPVHSTYPETYHNNFPTTGANNLYFDLNVANSPDLYWPSVSVGGITAKVSKISTTDFRVTLEGPAATIDQINSNTPNSIRKPILPARFELQGLSGGTAIVKYGFEIKQWFINRDNIASTANVQNAWCNSTGYKVPKIMDLTNAVGSGASISNHRNNFLRRIGGGLFSEWGDMPSFPNVGFQSDGYWTYEKTEENQIDEESGELIEHQYHVGSNSGGIGHSNPNSEFFAICRYP